MPFYLRKSIKAGPFRFNLSKSGVGVSAGVPGFRIGTGPRGNYVHVGRGGLYYRHSLSPAPSQNEADGKPPRRRPATVPPETAGVDMIEVESGSVLEMRDGSAAGLLAEFDAKQKTATLWPFVGLAFGLLVAIAAYQGQPPEVLAAAASIGVLGIFGVAALDRRRKMVVLLYDLEPEAEQAYRDVHEAFDRLNLAQGKWHIDAKGNVRDTKYHAGAGTVVNRNPISFSSESPANVKTNIPVPSIPVGRQTLCFFPDRLLVFDRAGVGAVPYEKLGIETASTRFVEDGTPAGDAKVVGRTWQYVNKSGGPDRRFRSNRELPIMLSDEIRFWSTTGLNECVQVSRVGPGREFVKALIDLATAHHSTSAQTA